MNLFVNNILINSLPDNNEFAQIREKLFVARDPRADVGKNDERRLPSLRLKASLLFERDNSILFTDKFRIDIQLFRCIIVDCIDSFRLITRVVVMTSSLIASLFYFYLPWYFCARSYYC